MTEHLGCACLSEMCGHRTVSLPTGRQCADLQRQPHAGLSQPEVCTPLASRQIWLREGCTAKGRCGGGPEVVPQKAGYTVTCCREAESLHHVVDSWSFHKLWVSAMGLWCCKAYPCNGRRDSETPEFALLFYEAAATSTLRGLSYA